MTDKLKNGFGKFKYPLLALVLGLIIMLLPAGGTDAGDSALTDEQRLAEVLGNATESAVQLRCCPTREPS